jgi:hypothetical protein
MPFNFHNEASAGFVIIGGVLVNYNTIFQGCNLRDLWASGAQAMPLAAK